MRIRSLRLENYRRFPEAFLEFPDGVVAIVGPNGAGKSTLLESITWCLFGHEAARTGKDLIKRSAAPPGADTLVRVEFELHGDGFVVTRRMRGKTLQADATVERNQQLQVASGANSSDQATQYVTRLLGMDHRAFHSTVMAKQGDLSALSDRTSGARKKLILGMLGVEDVESAIRLVRARKRETAARLDEVRRALAREAEIRERAQALEGQRVRVQAELDRWQERLAKERLQSEATLQEALALEKAQQGHRNLRGRLDGLQRGLDAFHAQRVRVGAELQLLSQRQSEWNRLRSEAERFADFEARWETMERDRAAFDHRHRVVEELQGLGGERTRWDALVAVSGPEDGRDEAEARRSPELRSRLDGLEREAAREEARVEEAGRELRRIQGEAASEQDRWRSLLQRGPEAPCPTCERPLGDAVESLAHRAAQHQEHVRGRMEGLRSEVSELTAHLAGSRILRERLGRELADSERDGEAFRLRRERQRLAALELDRIAKRRTRLEEELAGVPADAWDPAAQERLRAEREERDAWKEVSARLREALARVPKLREELATLAAEEERQRTEIMAASTELASLAYAEGSAEASRRRAEEQRNRVHEADREAAKLRERWDALEESRVAAGRDLAHLDSLRSQREGLEAALTLEEHLAADHGEKGILPDFKNHLITRIRPALARAAAQLVAEMTTGRYADLDFDEEYAVRLYEGGVAWPLERFSGGEADVVNLAVRLAVSELVARARGTSRLEFVALDEVLANQDEARRRSVLAALKGLSGRFRQVFLVTHWDEVRDGVDNVVRVLSESEGSSRVWASWNEGDGAPPQAPIPLTSRSR